MTPPPPLPSPTPPTPEPSPEPEVDVRISFIFYDGVVPYVESDEYAQITNNGTGIVDLQGWRLNAGDPGQDFVFPSYIHPARAVLSGLHQRVPP